MTMKASLTDIQKIHDYFLSIATHDAEKETLFRAMKLTEEVGELNQEVLKYYKHASKEKIEKFSRENMEGEFADVFITLVLLAQSLDVDIETALHNKLEIIKTRMWIV